MIEDVNMIKDMAKESMQGSIDHLIKELSKIRAGKAHPSMLDSVKVEYYGAKTPLSQVANVNTLDARTITVQPWEKTIIADIERAIMNANIGLNPQNNGDSIIINVPQLTEERRRDLVKQAKAAGEHAKVGIRNARKEANDEIKKLDGLPEDMGKDAETDIQTITNNFSTKVDTLIAEKEKDIMTL